MEFLELLLIYLISKTFFLPKKYCIFAKLVFFMCFINFSSMLLYICRYFGLGILLLCAFEGTAQDSVFTRQFIQMLCAPELYGRSASHQGEWKAAELIAKTMQENHLKPLEDSYFQLLSYANKAYSGEVTFKVDDRFLEPLEDFVIAPESKCETVCAEAVRLPITTLSSWKYKKSYKNKFLIVDLTQITYGKSKSKMEAPIAQGFITEKALASKALGLIFLVDDFSPYRVSRFQKYKDLIIIEAKKTAFPEKSDKISLTGTASFLPDYQTRNVIAYWDGAAVKDSFIVLTAHYDHLGTMGDNTIFYGANDNASGVALMLDLAKSLQKDTLKYTPVFIAFSGEEMGLYGSQFFTENPLIDLSKIKMIINFDLLCAGDQGINVVNGLNQPKEMELLTKINNENSYLTDITPTNNSKNSDHYWFTVHDVPAFFVFAKGKSGKYHHPDDSCENCTLSGYNWVFKLFYQFIRDLD
jgi:hypothetical protein